MWLTEETNDKQQLASVLEQVEQNLGVKPASADSGYWSEAQVSDERLRGIDLFVATGKQKHEEADEAAEQQPVPGDQESPLAAMKQKLKRTHNLLKLFRSGRSRQTA